ncbi:PREDICTED: extensin-like [Cyprinodon variegatus]|uniref:extensin-like n=1 Tax=Cyprinodon variegatus TaxID=28743 RepID=UPI0007428A82|nr:PREDICTED: extensin-like [Cyprinodon variegatus]
MPAPWGAAEASPRAPLAAGHPAVGPGKKQRHPQGTDRNAPAPQSDETSPGDRPQHPTRPHHPGKTHRRLRLRPLPGPMRIRREPAASASEPPKTPPRPKALPRPTKTDANSAQRNTPRTELTQEQKTARGQHRARVELTTPPPHRTKPEQHSHACRPSSPPAQAPNTPLNHLHRPDASRSEPLHQSSSTMPPSGKTHPKTQSAQPAHPHQPPNTNPAVATQTPTHQRRAASRTPTQRGRPPREQTCQYPPRKKNGKQKSPPNGTVDTRH